MPLSSPRLCVSGDGGTRADTAGTEGGEKAEASAGGDGILLSDTGAAAGLLSPPTPPAALSACEGASLVGTKRGSTAGTCTTANSRSGLLGLCRRTARLSDLL